MNQANKSPVSAARECLALYVSLALQDSLGRPQDTHWLLEASVGIEPTNFCLIAFRMMARQNALFRLGLEAVNSKRSNSQAKRPN